MMYIVLTAMLALNVASEVLEAFRVVDTSLIQTLEAVDQKNKQVYTSFDQAFLENPAKVKEWKDKADAVRNSTNEMFTYISDLQEELVKYSGSEVVTPESPLREDGYFYIAGNGDTLAIKKEDDLNAPSELMITQKRAFELNDEIKEYRNGLVSVLNENDVELREAILKELETPEPKQKTKEGGERKTWEAEYFLDKPLVAILTLLRKIQINVKNSEANIINYLYGQIDAGSFKFNKLGAHVIANSNIVLQGEPFTAEVFLAAEDTTLPPRIFIQNQEYDVNDGKATYTASTDEPGVFKWSGLIKYKTPGGAVRDYPFEHEYQVSKPSVTMSATSMNVFYLGVENPFEVGGGAIPNENLEVRMTNGSIRKTGDNYIIDPSDLDEQGRRTKVSVYANIGGEQRLVGSSDWRVKRVPDPVAQIDGRSGGNIRKEVLTIQDGVLAVLEDFDFDFKYKVTQFDLETAGNAGYNVRNRSNSDRFTPEQKRQLGRVRPQSIVYISNIKAIGDDGSTRDLDPISFKIQ